MSPGNSDGQISAVRAFNRFYTRKLGVFDQHFMKSPFSLSEGRVLYELAHRDDLAAKEIGIELGLDPGYLSRLIQNFDEKGLITRKPLPSDRRQYQLSLTAKGRQAFARLDRSSDDQVAAMLAVLAGGDRRRLVEAMAVIERLLDASRAPAPAILRDPRPGDMGWVVQSHGALYAGEYGFDASFEALVAEIAAKFLSSFDASRERCWIADIEGMPVGSVFLVRHSDDVAKLRLLLVDPAGRGQGLGQRLVGECIAFAKASGYRKVTARKIYQDSGFVLVASEPHCSFGQNLIGETWEREL
jgi:DNA-binding MarR family transcriptional regulator/predicted GNAT family acetyltransferase